MPSGPPDKDKNHRQKYLRDINDAYVFDGSSGLYKPQSYAEEENRKREKSGDSKRKRFFTDPKRDWVSIAISILTLIGLAAYTIYTRRQWIEARNMAEQSIKSADAAQSAATTAKSALDSSAASFKQEIRAYVATTQSEMSKPPLCNTPGEVRVCVNVHMTNSGRTPAIGVRLHRYATFGENAEKTIRKMKIPEYKSPDGTMLGNIGEQWGTAFTDPITQEMADKLIRADTPIFIYGVIQYFDIFGDYHETGYCWERVLRDNNFIACTYGNWFEKRPVH